MLQRLHFSGFFLIAVLISCGISLLLATDPIQMTLLFLSVLVLGAYLPIFIRESEKQQQNNFHIHQYQTMHQAFEQFSEYAIFTIDGALIKSSHSHLYPTLAEFIQKLNKRFETSEQWPMLKRWIEELHMGKILLKYEQNANEKHRILLARVLPQDQPHFPIKSIFVGFEDVTVQFSEIDSIQNELAITQRFIEKAPFGVFYLNKSRQIIACNHTLCDWLKQNREEILNCRIEHLMDGIEDCNTAKSKWLRLSHFAIHRLKRFGFLLL